MTEIQQYLATHKAVKEVFLGFCENYRKLGRFAGTVSVPVRTEKGEGAGSPALQELSAFFSRRIRSGSRISWAALEKAWATTRFREDSLEGILRDLWEAHHGSPLAARKEERAERQDQADAILSRLLVRYTAGRAGRWLRFLQEGRKEARSYRLAHMADYLDEGMLTVIARALASLPKEKFERLPFFANRVTGDSHAFDEKTRAGRLFLQALSWLYPEEARLSDRQSMLYYRAHILRDDIQNFVTAFAICPDGETAAYWRAAAQSFSPLDAPLREIVRAGRYLPYGTSDNPLSSFDVFIVENSGVFSALMDALAEKGCHVPLLCLHGQVNLAGWALLDRLSAAGARFHYSGDYDPEGLLIAQGVLDRYPLAEAWRFDAGCYRPDGASLSEPRLKKLASITSPSLLGVCAAVQKGKAAFYQESLFPLLLEDMMKIDSCG